MKAIAEFLGGAVSGALPWRWILGGLAVVAALSVWGYVAHLQNENDRLQGELALALDAAEQNARAYAAEKKSKAEVVAALAAERDAYARRVKRLTEIRSEVDHAPQSDDGPVAPVLGRVLERLRRNAHRDENPGGAPPGPGEPVDLSVNAGATGR